LDNIPHDLSFAYTLKAAFEDILGPQAFRKLKECQELRIWKSESKRLLQASLIAFQETVEISDDAFREEMADTINFGIQTIGSSKSINQLFSSLAATYCTAVILTAGFGCKSVEVQRVAEETRLEAERLSHGAIRANGASETQPRIYF
jgi:hypothetical protein